MRPTRIERMFGHAADCAPDPGLRARHPGLNDEKLVYFRDFNSGAMHVDTILESAPWHPDDWARIKDLSCSGLLPSARWKTNRGRCGPCLGQIACHT
jgi:hypothetical protein